MGEKLCMRKSKALNGVNATLKIQPGDRDFTNHKGIIKCT